MPLGTLNDSQQPGELVGLDYVGPMDGKHILVKADSMYRVLQLDVCSSAIAETSIVGLRKWRKKYGLMDRLISDQGTHFCNE